MPNTIKYPILYDYALFKWSVMNPVKSGVFNLLKDTWVSRTALFSYLEAKKISGVSDTYNKLVLEQDSRLYNRPRQSL